jgi:hypothetical protein
LISLKFAKLVGLTVLCIAASGAFGDVPAEIIDKAKNRFSKLYYESEAGLIVGKLQHRGLTATGQVEIATDIASAIADCIIDGLSDSQLQVSYTYLVLIADESIEEDLGGRLRDAYPRAEVEEFNNLTVQLMRDCRKAAYATHHLSPD